MGCVMSKSAMMKEYRAEHMPIAKSLASQPRQLSNGNTFIPVNYMNGEYPTIYPKWLENDISPRQYHQIIEKLNNLNKVSAVWNEQRMVQYSKLSHSKAKRLIASDKKTLYQEMDTLLFEINNNILNPLCLNASTTLKKQHVQPSEMGIIIKKIHMHCDLSGAAKSDQGQLIILPVYESLINEHNERTLST